MDLLKVYPSGRVTASKRRKFASDPPPKPLPFNEETEEDLRLLGALGLEQYSCIQAEFGRSPTLGLSSVPNLSTTPPPLRAKRGSNGISSASRQLVKDAATLLQDRYGKERLSFITHTIPDPYVDAVHGNWAAILANLRRRYIRALQKAGLPQDLVMVTEYQEKRLAESGKAVLHLHIVMVGRYARKHWQWECEWFHNHWRECCEQYIQGGSCNTEWNAATRVESIRKNVADYLGKYMSKGVQAIGLVRNCGVSAFVPPSWHVLSQRLRRAVRVATRHYEGAGATALYDWLRSNAGELLRFHRDIEIALPDGRAFIVGWYGDLRDRSLFKCASVP